MNLNLDAPSSQTTSGYHEADFEPSLLALAKCCSLLTKPQDNSFSLFFRENDQTSESSDKRKESFTDKTERPGSDMKMKQFLKQFPYQVVMRLL
jgi:hypothetical protein